MRRLTGALVEISGFLAERKIPYMIIGGMANLQWGEPRSTFDIDVTLLLDDAKIESFIGELSALFTILPAKAVGFVRKSRVLPVLSKSTRVRLDLIFALLPYEEEALGRARSVSVGKWKVKYCSPEDLILHKIVSEREKDRSDVRALIQRNRNSLDMEYLSVRVRELSRTLEAPEILGRFKAFLYDK